MTEHWVFVLTDIFGRLLESKAYETKLKAEQRQRCYENETLIKKVLIVVD